MESPQTSPLDKLTDKQKAFVLLTNANISAAISLVLEQFGMSAGESIGRMTRFGRATMESFLTDDGQLTLTSEEAVENRGLLKKVRQKRTIRTTHSNGSVETVEEIQTEFEMYDAMTAVDKMLQVHGRYKLKIDISNLTDAQVEELLNKAMNKLD